ncbi:hypothetical protein [Streptomyces echinatus]|uniref:hypothetical protein n=1 Tax=Streptomyces echinatus TaxID=67293 RepID=UPI00381E96D0
MPESVQVRCPVCRRAHVYTAPAYPCVCGAPIAPRLDPAAEPAVAEHRAWDDEWLTVACAACGRPGHWPRPELGCPCGTVLRVPVAPRRSDGSAGTGPGQGQGRGQGMAASADPVTARTVGRSPADGTRRPGKVSGPGARSRGPGDASGPVGRRPPFQPRVIRTARDAVTTTALYLRWLGYRDIRRADQRPPNGIGLAARGLLAQVDPSVRPAAPRDVECLWLTAMAESAGCVYFSLAGYAEEARVRADSLEVPLFVLGPTGVPRPVNASAVALDATAD